MNKVLHVTVHYIDADDVPYSFNVHRPDKHSNGSENALKRRILELAEELHDLHSGAVVCRE